jgi:hypothetical protein
MLVQDLIGKKDQAFQSLLLCCGVSETCSFSQAGMVSTPNERQTNSIDSDLRLAAQAHGCVEVRPCAWRAPQQDDMESNSVGHMP